MLLRFWWLYCFIASPSLQMISCGFSTSLLIIFSSKISMNSLVFLVCLLFFFWPCLWHMEVLLARDRTLAIARTQAAAVTVPDPWHSLQQVFLVFRITSIVIWFTMPASFREGIFFFTKRPVKCYTTCKMEVKNTYIFSQLKIWSCKLKAWKCKWL